MLLLFSFCFSFVQLLQKLCRCKVIIRNLGKSKFIAWRFYLQGNDAVSAYLSLLADGILQIFIQNEGDSASMNNIALHIT